MLFARCSACFRSCNYIVNLPYIWSDAEPCFLCVNRVGGSFVYDMNGCSPQSTIKEQPINGSFVMSLAVSPEAEWFFVSSRFLLAAQQMSECRMSVCVNRKYRWHSKWNAVSLRIRLNSVCSMLICHWNVSALADRQAVRPLRMNCTFRTHTHTYVQITHMHSPCRHFTVSSEGILQYHCANRGQRAKQFLRFKDGYSTSIGRLSSLSLFFFQLVGSSGLI